MDNDAPESTKKRKLFCVPWRKFNSGLVEKPWLWPKQVKWREGGWHSAGVIQAGSDGAMQAATTSRQVVTTVQYSQCRLPRGCESVRQSSLLLPPHSCGPSLEIHRIGTERRAQVRPNC
jgi:hypothetical protein